MLFEMCSPSLVIARPIRYIFQMFFGRPGAHFQPGLLKQTVLLPPDQIKNVQCNEEQYVAAADVKHRQKK